MMGENDSMGAAEQCSTILTRTVFVFSVKVMALVERAIYCRG